MRRSHKFLAALITGALGLGLAAAPASATSAGPSTSAHAASFASVGPLATGKKSATKSGVKVTLSTKDLVNKKGKLKTKAFIKLTVKAPAPIVDQYTGALEPVRWYASVTSTGKGSCTGIYQATGTVEGSGTYTIPVEFQAKKVSKTLYYYIGSGKCKVTADVRAYRYSTDAAGSGRVDQQIKVSTNVYIRDKAKISATAPKKVKKNKTFTVSGTANYVAATKKVYYKTKAAPKGAKVLVQYQKNGKGAWKTIKTTKVGKAGKYSVKLKLKAKGKVRVVLAKTNTRAQAVSAKKSIAVKK